LIFSGFHCPCALFAAISYDDNTKIWPTLLNIDSALFIVVGFAFFTLGLLNEMSLCRCERGCVWGGGGGSLHQTGVILDGNRKSPSRRS